MGCLARSAVPDRCSVSRLASETSRSARRRVLLVGVPEKHPLLRKQLAVAQAARRIGAALRHRHCCNGNTGGVDVNLGFGRFVSTPFRLLSGYFQRWALFAFYKIHNSIHRRYCMNLGLPLSASFGVNYSDAVVGDSRSGAVDAQRPGNVVESAASGFIASDGTCLTVLSVRCTLVRVSVCQLSSSRSQVAGNIHGDFRELRMSICRSPRVRMRQNTTLRRRQLSVRLHREICGDSMADCRCHSYMDCTRD